DVRARQAAAGITFRQATGRAGPTGGSSAPAERAGRHVIFYCKAVRAGTTSGAGGNHKGQTMETLRRSIENLEPPHCPNCHVEMKWYRSNRPLSAEDPDRVDQFFICPNCHKLETLSSRVRTASGGSDGPAQLNMLWDFHCEEVLAA
ncbi:MAG TPA: hypothetical protein VE224_04495, partial [Pseudolabrys sp.]|nr:hypothetical protein [Pseudolabrys sp.]